VGEGVEVPQVVDVVGDRLLWVEQGAPGDPDGALVDVLAPGRPRSSGWTQLEHLLFPLGADARADDPRRVQLI
jgi:hypothetical protein